MNLFRTRFFIWCCLLGLTGVVFVDFTQSEVAAAERNIQRILLLGQGPDGHPFGTHEYNTAMRIVRTCLKSQKNLQIITESADEPWEQGPELLDGADAAVIFLSQGAKWLQKNPARLQAFQRLAKRGGALTVLHWGMGTKDAKDISAFVNLLGGCHGGPDRRYKVVEVKTQLPTPGHPIVRGVKPVQIKDEFYYTLKFAQPVETIVPILNVPIEGRDHTVAWAWNRPDGGRSFGFSGLHFHENWQDENYRRMVTQAIVWTLKRPIPKKGFDVTLDSDVFVVPKREK